MIGWLENITTGKIHISLGLTFFLFTIPGNLQLPFLHFIPRIPDKFIEFNKFNTNLKRENSIVLVFVNRHGTVPVSDLDSRISDLSIKNQFITVTT